jgi:alpha-N-arabinofuranosidase
MPATITVDPTAVIAPIHPWLFGSFVEHLRRCVYGGIYDPGSALSDAEGFRADVLETVRGLVPTHLRYPGGNFVSGYQWRDGIGWAEQITASSNTLPVPAASSPSPTRLNPCQAR